MALGNKPQNPATVDIGSIWLKALVVSKDLAS